jgi:hypothetical protein
MHSTETNVSVQQYPQFYPNQQQEWKPQVLQVPAELQCGS